MNAETYLMNLKVKLAVSSSIQSVEIIDERIVLSDRGYFSLELIDIIEKEIEEEMSVNSENT